MTRKQKDLKIGQILKEARKKKGLTQRQVANKLGYGSVQFVSLFERGLSKIPYKTWKPLCEIVGISTKRLVKIDAEFYRKNIEELIK